MANDINRSSVGQRVGPQRTKQPPPVPSKPNVQSAALLGASLAFDGKGTGRPLTAQSANSTRNSRRLAAMDLGAHRFELQDDETLQQDSFPESSVGIVGDRIKRFTEGQGHISPQPVHNGGANTSRPGAVRPQQIAALLAVGSSTARTSPAGPTKGSLGHGSPGQENNRSPGRNDRSAVSNISSNKPRRNGLVAQEDRALTAPALAAEKAVQFTDPHGTGDVNSRSSAGQTRKEHTGSLPSSSSLYKELLHPSPPDMHKNHSSSLGKQGPPLPPRPPTAPVNKSDLAQEIIPPNNVIAEAVAILENTPPGHTTSPTSVRTVISGTGDPRSQMLPSRASRSSLKPQHSGLSDSSLAGALAASSLASSRAPSPSKKNPPPPPPPHRGSRSRPSLNPLHSIHKNEPRTPSPSKGMRQTLRQEPKSDDEAKRRKRLQRTGIIKTHPNKHREGDRKRWRDRITERERKRYEGVWAANKGLLINENRKPGTHGPAPQDMVLNLVVRDIWCRSRLQVNILEQIWDLVCHDNRRMLTRQEFVVGMWLIDQSLKGRKLPTKVSQSVWDSVHQIQDPHSRY
ncbi:hypothetical protein AJ78_00915 [Emergomyces pasteurianus Ep9510]|uniref:EH domain-containing protein n=1 Tax=Emergomyces pasteurianus Ep9510 TaxID=1447872 RepID=A0A1J9PRT9_9EURO|nr:hypothetical protein AJ78_00915 [Emergomyces pasteurianus Ep9510]